MSKSFWYSRHVIRKKVLWPYKFLKFWHFSAKFLFFFFENPKQMMKFSFFQVKIFIFLHPQTVLTFLKNVLWLWIFFKFIKFWLIFKNLKIFNLFSTEKKLFLSDFSTFYSDVFRKKSCNFEFFLDFLQNFDSFSEIQPNVKIFLQNFDFLWKIQKNFSIQWNHKILLSTQEYSIF